MGTVISKAANGFGSVLGNFFSAPFKTIFGESCEDVCAGPWDVLCFIEHLCVSNLVKLLMILGLCYLFLLFFYLLFQLGICQCIGRSLCRMCWASCSTYCHALEYITCFLWYKLKNTKRVHHGRRHFQDVERSYITSSESDFSNNYHHLSISRKRKSIRAGKKVQMRSSRYPSSRSHRRHHNHHQHHVRLKTRQNSFRIQVGSTRQGNSRQLQLVSVKNHSIDHLTSFKRRRLE